MGSAQHNESNYTYISTWASRNSSSDLSSVGCHIGMSKYFFRKGHTTLLRMWNRKTYNKQAYNENNKYNGHNENNQIIVLPQSRSWRFDPVLAGAFWCKEIHRRAILVVFGNATIATIGGASHLFCLGMVQPDGLSDPSSGRDGKWDLWINKDPRTISASARLARSWFINSLRS